MKDKLTTIYVKRFHFFGRRAGESSRHEALITVHNTLDCSSVLPYWWSQPRKSKPRILFPCSYYPYFTHAMWDQLSQMRNDGLTFTVRKGLVSRMMGDASAHTALTSEKHFLVLAWAPVLCIFSSRTTGTPPNCRSMSLGGATPCQKDNRRKHLSRVYICLKEFFQPWPGGSHGWITVLYTLKDCRFNFWSGHIPRLWVQSPSLGSSRKQPIDISHSHQFLSLPKISKHILGWELKNIFCRRNISWILK